MNLSDRSQSTPSGSGLPFDLVDSRLDVGNGSEIFGSAGPLFDSQDFGKAKELECSPVELKSSAYRYQVLVTSTSIDCSKATEVSEARLQKDMAGAKQVCLVWPQPARIVSSNRVQIREYPEKALDIPRGSAMDDVEIHRRERYPLQDGGNHADADELDSFVSETDQDLMILTVDVVHGRSSSWRPGRTPALAVSAME